MDDEDREKQGDISRGRRMKSKERSGIEEHLRNWLKKKEKSEEETERKGSR